MGSGTEDIGLAVTLNISPLFPLPKSESATASRKRLDSTKASVKRSPSTR
jgi:hypothetical protein